MDKTTDYDNKIRIARLFIGRRKTRNKIIIFIFLILILYVFGISRNIYAGQAISDFTELAEKPAVGDLLIVVDVSDTTDAATGTTKKITKANLFKGVPYDLNCGIYYPNDSITNVYIAKLQRAVTLASLGCIIDPADSDETVVVDVYECDSNGDNCAVIVEQITCANTPTAANVTDAALASGAFLKITIGTVTGTVTSLLIYGTGTQDW